MEYTLLWPKGHLMSDAPLAAFGMGIDRIAMLKCGMIKLRRLRHYGFGTLNVLTLHVGCRGEF